MAESQKQFKKFKYCPVNYFIAQSHLGDRVKELESLYEFIDLIEREDCQDSEIYQGMVDLIPPAYHHPKITCARLSVSDKVYTSKKFKETNWHQSGRIIVGKEQIGILEIFFSKEITPGNKGPFPGEERDLINNLCKRLGGVIKRLHAIVELVESQELLEKKYNALEEKNSTLKEIVFQLELQKNQVEQNIQSNVEALILPVLEKLKTGEKNDLHIEILTDALRELTSSFNSSLKSRYNTLSSREIEICNLLKNGLSSKEIADVLSISSHTINKHRFHIRTKLGVAGGKENLVSLLNSIN